MCFSTLFFLLLASCVPVVRPAPTSAPAPILPATLTPTQAEQVVTLIPLIEFQQTLSPTPAPPTATTAGTALDLVNIRMFDPDHGWAVDQNGRLLRTGAGLQAWQDVSPWPASLEPGQTQQAVFFLDAHTAFAAQMVAGAESGLEMNFWRTQDGGASWQTFPVTFAEQEMAFTSPTQLIFLDDQRGWMYAQIYPGMHHCETVIYATQDGGATWKLVESSMQIQQTRTTGYLPGAYSLPYGPQVLTFLDERVGFAGNGALMATFDGGHDWREQILPPEKDQPRLNNRYHYVSPAWFTSPEDGALIENLYKAEDVEIPPGDVFQVLPKQTLIYTTHNGGETWEPHLAPALAGTLNFLDASIGWYLGATALGQTVLYRTQDGGATWAPVAVNAPLPLGTRLAFIDQSFGLAYNFYGAAQNQQNLDPRATFDPYLFITRDGGASWEKVIPSRK